MIDNLLKTFGGSLKRFTKPIPTFYRSAHPLSIPPERKEHLLLMDLWFYSQINQTDFFDLLDNDQVQTHITHELENVNREEELTFLNARHEQIKMAYRKIELFITTRRDSIKEKEAQLKNLSGAEKLKVESEIKQLTSEIKAIDLEERLARTNMVLSDDAIQAIHESPQKTLVVNYFFLKKLLNVLDTQSIYYLFWQNLPSQPDSIIKLTPENLKKYFSEQIRKYSSSQHRREFFSTLTFKIATKEGTIAINLQTCQVLIEEHGIVHLANLSKTSEFIVAYLIELGRTRNAAEVEFILDTLYRDASPSTTSQASGGHISKSQVVES